MRRFSSFVVWALVGIIVAGAAVLVVAVYRIEAASAVILPHPKLAFWELRSVDTMKYSRDPAREALADPKKFDIIIARQVGDIALTGATHVAIGTPYDEEFLPVIRRWVAAARANHLKIWFRGNFSGWEGWFNYSKIDRATHLERTEAFIRNHADLFEDGDVFSACPECENGGPGDPRMTGDVSGFRKFLIDEYLATKSAFADIEKNVRSNYLSMNGDVARLVMDKSTTVAIGGVVTIDHYVPTADILTDDIRSMAKRSNARIVLGEFGTPIPDINGPMDQRAQAEWIEEALTKLAASPDFIGLNYWTSVGGTTALWDDKGNARLAVKTLTNFFRPYVVYGTVRDELGRPLVGASVTNGFVKVQTDWRGYFEFIDREREKFVLKVTAEGCTEQIMSAVPSNEQLNIVMQYQNDSLWFKALRITQEALRSFDLLS